MRGQHFRIQMAVLLTLFAMPARPVNWKLAAPEWAAAALAKKGVSLDPSAPFVIAMHVNPYILFGDFDGDHKTDVAVLVRERKTGKVGIAVALQRGRTDVLGAGTEMGNGGDDFAWLDHWSVYTKAPVERGADETKPPKLIGDALLVEKSESASGIIYFTGSRYSWYQQGD